MEGLKEATHYRDQSNHLALIYEVEIVDASKPRHRGDYYKVSPQPNASYLQEMDRVAHDYWKGTEIVHPEIVIESGIKIIQCIAT